MTSFIRTFVTGASLVIAATFATAAPALARDTAAPAPVRDFKPLIGRAYFVSYYEGLPGGAVHRLTAQEWDQLVYLDRVCQGDLKAQRPSGLSEVFHTTFVGALGGTIGYGAGYAAAGYNSDTVRAGVKLGGVVGAVGGIVGGIDGRGRAKRYDQGQCMAYAVNKAQQIDHALIRVGIIINSHAVNGKGLRRPDESITNASDPVTEATSDSTASPVVIQ